MTYIVATSEEEGKVQIERLVTAFQNEFSTFKSTSYSEAQLRADFLDPFLKCLGWDVANVSNKSQAFREVLQEESIDVEEDSVRRKKNPDYTLRIMGERKVFLEAKKPSISLLSSANSAFQVRRYGWSANLRISILSNFEHLIVYDCRYIPAASDSPEVARFQMFHFSEFIERFDKIYQLISFESVAAGYLEQQFEFDAPDTIAFDKEFLNKIENWRLEFGSSIIEKNASIGQEEINFLVQRLLNRIVFLRICEDLEIEEYERLKAVADYEGLKTIFQEADQKFDSGLFDFIEDELSLRIQIDSRALIEVFQELYYPQSPYDFSIVEPAILSEIYDRWLGSTIHIGVERSLFVKELPEVSESDGVVPTPKFIVTRIVRDTVQPLCEGKTTSQIRNLKIADICCGSGTFLLEVFELLIQEYLSRYANGDGTIEVIHSVDGTYRLSLEEKRRILSQQIFGVDINPYATEVARFSLLLKLIEDENSASVQDFLSRTNAQLLPNLSSNVKCGNSLIDSHYFELFPSTAEITESVLKLNPFDWEEEFEFLAQSGGFDAIVGNPPYVRIQNMVKYAPEEIKYLQDKNSIYTTGRSANIDKYYFFIERAIQLLRDIGKLGYIVPNKFFVLKGGKNLRNLICETASFRKIFHFGVTQVFPGRATYTAILILDKSENPSFEFHRVSNLRMIQGETTQSLRSFRSAYLSESPWVFISEEAEQIFDRIRENATSSLGSIVDITVGLQTSNDKVYVIKDSEISAETESTIVFEKDNVQFEVEKELLRPCLYKADIKLFDQPESNAAMIFPYIINGNDWEVIAEDIMESEYPLMWAYLNNFKSVLEKRSINGSQEPKWYQFGRSQSLTKFHNAEKLIWSVLSTEAGYGYDRLNSMFTGGGNGPYYSILSKPQTSYSLYYVLAVLSHPVIEAMVKAGASEFRGEYYSHGKQFIENLPFKTIDFQNQNERAMHNEIVSIVRRLIETKERIDSSSIPSQRDILRRQYARMKSNLEEKTNDLLGISSEDINVFSNGEFLLADPNIDE